MAKTLDLNALDQMTLEIKMRDEQKSIFRLTTPTTHLVERFIGVKAEISGVAESHDADKIKKLYELAAELISCNLDYVTVTAEELRDRYRLTFGDLVLIFAAYMDFLKEFNNAKN